MAVGVWLAMDGASAFGQAGTPPGESTTELAQKVNNPGASIRSIPIRTKAPGPVFLALLIPWHHQPA